MPPGPLQVARDHRGVVTLTLDRPEARNALDPALVGRLRDTFEELAEDDAVRVVVLTGTGRAFCAGADLHRMSHVAHRAFDDNVRDARDLERMLRAVHHHPRPVVARVNGHALGGGAGLASCCDVVVAAAHARFGFPEARLGLAPAVICPYVLPRTGVATARRLFLTGERFDAAQAQRYGLVDLLAESGRLDGAVGRLVDDLLAAGPQAQEEIKAMLPRVAAARDLDEAAEVTVATIARLRVSDEGQQGMRAFLERRQPTWRLADGQRPPGAT
ncbi:MAG TPA: enoyl-CoA hydratase-related protein [Nitriliruptorales bacterium]|nr:enoyl-CoA hydratase-related protein [Nitriliruptorales bacterium]